MKAALAKPKKEKTVSVTIFAVVDDEGRVQSAPWLDIATQYFGEDYGQHSRPTQIVEIRLTVPRPKAAKVRVAIGEATYGELTSGDTKR